MAFCFQNCSDLLLEKNVLVIEKTLEFAKFLRSLNRTIYSNSERWEQFLKQNTFFNLFLEVSQIEYIRTTRIPIGIQKHAGKVWKSLKGEITCSCSNSSRILSRLSSSFSYSWKKEGLFLALLDLSLASRLILGFSEKEGSSSSLQESEPELSLPVEFKKNR